MNHKILDESQDIISRFPSFQSFQDYLVLGLPGIRDIRQLFQGLWCTSF